MPSEGLPTALHITRDSAEYMLCAAAHNTYVATWSGIVYVAFIFDAFSRMIVGLRAATAMTTDLVLDALEMAIWNRRREGITDLSGLVHHNDYAELCVKPMNRGFACVGGVR